MKIDLELAWWEVIVCCFLAGLLMWIMDGMPT